MACKRCASSRQRCARCATSRLKDDRDFALARLRDAVRRREGRMVRVWSQWLTRHMVATGAMVIHPPTCTCNGCVQDFTLPIMHGQES